MEAPSCLNARMSRPGTGGRVPDAASADLRGYRRRDLHAAISAALCPLEELLQQYQAQGLATLEGAAGV